LSDNAKEYFSITLFFLLILIGYFTSIC